MRKTIGEDYGTKRGPKILNYRNILALSASFPEHAAISSMIDKVPVKLHACAACKCQDGACPSFTLCRKRILIVGGFARMESLYRQVIEGMDGVFDYHDGNVKNGAKKLEGRLKRADLVLCLINCNSHAACSIAKSVAKRHRKSVYMLPNSGLTVVFKAVRGESPTRTAAR